MLPVWLVVPRGPGESEPSIGEDLRHTTLVFARTLLFSVPALLAILVSCTVYIHSESTVCPAHQPTSASRARGEQYYTRKVDVHGSHLPLIVICPSNHQRQLRVLARAQASADLDPVAGGATSASLPDVLRTKVSRRVAPVRAILIDLVHKEFAVDG